ncbi:acyl-CoA dehydrogenase [Haladaptatus litoreus]|uniref:Acyl-CoA dehydrogenase n=1 Tax=Haladaptatus litoreus TaxID=553468 RepID=A0A1N7F153_9EURY|nr:acyl-CoA dehydrogenase family protein [Haladaptatus litoreus]SIR94078.1 acyl-CoA dehydrogenase [Haladaptatus litoreus]
MLEFSEEQRLIQREVRRICDDFDDEYWRKHDRNAEYPMDFVQALGEHGWLGTVIPEEYNGAGLDPLEAAIILEEISASGAGFNGSMACHGAMFIPRSVLNYGSEEMKEKLLPKLATGEKLLQCFALTEPNAGFDSTSITTTAERDGDTYVINGQKTWCSRFHASDYMVLVARTTPKEEVAKKTQGMSLFLIDIEDAKEQGAVDATEIEKNIRAAVPSYEIWFEDLEVPAENLIGEEGNGFYQVMDGLNEERVVIAAEAVGLARVAIDRGVQYGIEREVFDRQIGSNQAIQHPLADAYARMTAARNITYQAARAFKEGRDVGEAANIAAYMAREAASEAADAAVQTHGGYGVAVEYDVERFYREARLTRIAPISDEMILNYIGEHVLDLPRSY